ncbi:hypothetical protein CAPTEDRAFT_128578 [Capitella teleta]|uniref:Transmembrane protein 45B n=1 Tax=Capitella teleta TaxID=283909 RepID=R7U367_CAPTE|nr:hypothetical protein CAPTEDRAFT_128578 [Capitella teleta]|eukprot:ELT98121.1 hypothetical protein CAPTEDRAFT_128578 [Capitella teleta]
MGNFGGHALPGSFFLVFSMWWTYHIFCRYYRSLVKGGLPFKGAVTYPCTCLCGRLKTWEVEGAVLIFFTTVGFTLEIITAFKDGKFTYYGNGQHATMFFFFGLSGVIDILVHHRFPLPKNIEYVTMTLAFLIEGLLFKFHLHGRDEMDVLLHTLLLYAVFGTLLCCLLEMKFRQSAMVSLARTFFVALQGSWFWQIGFVLYNPFEGHGDWDHDNHDQMMVITMMFAWHIAAILLLMLAVGGVIGWAFFRKTDQTSYDPMNLQLIKRHANGQTVINLHDTDSEIDFEEFSQTRESLIP